MGIIWKLTSREDVGSSKIGLVEPLILHFMAACTARE